MAAIDAAAIAGAKRTLRKAILFRRDSRTKQQREHHDGSRMSLIESALAESNGRVSGPRGAAAKLGIPQSTLDSKIKALKINKQRFRRA